MYKFHIKNDEPNDEEDYANGLNGGSLTVEDGLWYFNQLHETHDITDVEVTITLTKKRN